MKSEIILIAAHANNLVIGNKGYIPWHLPVDLKRFKQLTIGNPIIMGRKTFESVGSLPKRDNIIVSNTMPVGTYGKDTISTYVTTSLTSALEIASYSDKVFIIGGGELYKQSLDLADTLELTVLTSDYIGDTFFPNYAYLLNTRFRLDKEEVFSTYSYRTYRRIK